MLTDGVRLRVSVKSGVVKSVHALALSGDESSVSEWSSSDGTGDAESELKSACTGDAESDKERPPLTPQNPNSNTKTTNAHLLRIVHFRFSFAARLRLD